MEGEYYLARAYEELGQARHAIDSYQRLLQARGEADTTIAFLNDARRRLDRLTTKH